MAETTKTKWTPGPYSEPTPYGLLGFEIQGQGRSIAVVNRVGSARLSYLHGRINAKAKRGESGDADACEAAELESRAAEALATAHLFKAAPELYEVLADIVDVLTRLGGTPSPRLVRAQAVLAKAEGRHA